jgi:hypothetical protein
LQEYLDIGIFFSNLDIKKCPNCDHSVSLDRIKAQKETYNCALCNEVIDTSEEKIERETFSQKIENLKILNERLKEELVTLTKEYETQNNIYIASTTELVDIEKKKEKIRDINLLNNELKEIEEIINTVKASAQDIDVEREDLISKKAVIDFQVRQIEDTNEPSMVEKNFDDQIELLDHAIKKLNEIRYQSNLHILNRLSEIMLSELNEFGLQSITEVKITDQFEIKYKQDGEDITFNAIAEGEQLRAKLALYLGLIQLDIERNFGRHTRFLIIDSPGKEEGDANYLKGLSNVLKSIQARFSNNLQILIGTAERDLAGIVENEYITPINEYIF